MLPVDIASYDYSAKTAIVIGAGIAGVSAAYSLAKRGWNVDILERSDMVASAASGNPTGIIMPSLAHKGSPMGRWHNLCYGYIQDYLATIDKGWFPCGALQLAGALKKRAIQSDKRYIDASSASERAGIELKDGGLWFSDAGYVVPKFLCESFLENITEHICVHYGWDVERLTYEGGSWTVFDKQEKVASASVVVVANAYDALNLEQCQWLPVKPLRGQVTCLSKRAFPSLKTVLCYDGYIIPSYEGMVCMGATYDYTSEIKVLESDHLKNISLLEGATGLQITDSPIGGRCAVRTTTTDRLPLLGAVPKLDDYKQRVIEYYRSFRGRKKREVESLFYPGLYVSIGHGSRGLSSAPYAGEVLASLIDSKPLLEDSILRFVLPQRFLWREVRN
jgi:tRNA 5-methylaminomethyl-2-thiouridine biosynthesis bifunctional protein